MLPNKRGIRRDNGNHYSKLGLYRDNGKEEGKHYSSPCILRNFLSEADVEKTLKLQGDSLFQANADLNRLGCDPPLLL